MNLKSTSAAKLEAESAANTIAHKLAEAIARRDALSAEIESLDATVEGAEIAHAVVLATVELDGPESVDTGVAMAALNEANTALASKPELIQNRRVADALVDGLNRRHIEAHGRYVALIEQHKVAQIEHLSGKAQQAMDEAREAIAAIANKVAEAQAVRRVLESVGGRWTFGGIEVNQYSPMFNPDRNAVELMAAALHNEIA